MPEQQFAHCRLACTGGEVQRSPPELIGNDVDIRATFDKEFSRSYETRSRRIVQGRRQASFCFCINIIALRQGVKDHPPPRRPVGPVYLKNSLGCGVQQCVAFVFMAADAGALDFSAVLLK